VIWNFKKKRRRVGIVGTVGLPASYGGFETLVSYLAENSPEDVELKIYCSSLHYSDRKPRYGRHIRRFLPFKANGSSSIIYDIVSLIISIFTCDAILVLGVSGATVLPVVRLLFRGRIVTNIDGLEWKRTKWGFAARHFLRLSEYVAVRFSHVVVGDNKGITDYIHTHYRRNAELVEYGGPHTDLAHTIPPRPSGVRFSDYVYSLCRIEPENHVEVILEGAVRSGIPIVFVGNWDASAYGRRIWDQYSNETGVQLMGPVFEREWVASLRYWGRAYVHGHSAGGTNPSLVEALHFGNLPICYDVSYNRYTTFGVGLYFRTVHELREHLVNVGRDRAGSSVPTSQLQQKSICYYSWARISSLYFSHLKST